MCAATGMTLHWIKTRLTAPAFREARSLTAALVCCIATRMVIVDQRTMLSQSMHPTLELGDRILVDKVSVVLGKLPGRSADLGLRRGDMVVFRPPEASRSLYAELLHGTSGKAAAEGEVGFMSIKHAWRRRRELRRSPLNSRLDYTKRVVALAGDRVAVRRGLLYINGRPADPLPRISYAGRPPSQRGPDDGKRMRQDSTRASYSFSTTVVPQRQVMVLGDNRDASFDSHVWGPLPVGNVLGLARARYWPFGRAAWFDRGPFLKEGV